MSAIEIVKRNTFYKKQNITTGINIKPEFKDLAEAANNITGSKTFKLSTGSDTNVFVLSGSTPDTIPYGAGDLVGGYLSLFCTETSGNSARENPDVLLYKLNPDVTLAEGNYNLATRSGSTASGAVVVGDKVAVYNSRPSSMIPKISENFEGANVSLGISRLGNNSVVTYTDPYIYAGDLKMYLQHSGDYTTQKDFNRFVKNCVKISLDGLGAGTTTKTGEGDRLMLRPWATSRGYMTYEDVQGIKKTGLVYRLVQVKSTLQSITAERTANYINKRRKWLGMSGGSMSHLWKRNFSLKELDRLGLMGWMKTTSSGPELDSNPGANEFNTIFSDISSTKLLSNPYEATENSPLIFTEVSLSSEQSTNDGQALKFYHNWGHSSMNYLIQDDMGTDNNLNPQVMRASIYNIPMPPLPFDVGMNKVDNNSSVYMYGDMHSVVPELQMSMYVSKLSPNLPLNISGGADYATTNTVRPFSRWGAGSGGTGLMPKNLFTTSENSFLRSITVTFSNFKPKNTHTTLDKFLTYGLDRFYSGEDNENIIGGYTINTFSNSLVNAFGAASLEPTKVGSDDDMWVCPLPVTPINQLTSESGNPANAKTTLLSGGISAVSGTAAASGGDLNRLDKLIWGVTPTSDKSHGNLKYLPIQSLPMQTWIKTRIFTDIFQHNNSGSSVALPYAASSSANPSTNDPKTAGVPMRVLFQNTGGPEDNDGGAYSYTQLGANTDSNELVPFIDIPFPVSSLTSFSTTVYYQSSTTVTISDAGGEPIFVGMQIKQNVGGNNIIPTGAYVAAITTGTEGVDVTEFTMNIAATAAASAGGIGLVSDFYSGPEDGIDYTFNEKPEWYPSVMTIWVQNYPWTSGSAATRDAVPGTNAIAYGDNLYAPSGQATEIEMYIDDIALLNYGPEVLNITANAGNSNLSLQPAQYNGPFAGMVSGNSSTGFASGRYKTGWVQSDPLVNEVALCSLESGSAQVKLLIQSGSLSAGRLENAATRNTAGSYATLVTGTGIPATTYIKIVNSDTLTLVDGSDADVPATVTSAATNVTFNSSGTLQPYVNKANLHTYDVGTNICLGFDNKADLPTLNAGATARDGYILFNNFNTDSMTTVQNNPLKPDKITHLCGVVGYELGGTVSQASGSNQTKTLGSQLYAPNYYIENDGTYGTGSNISGAAIRVIDSGNISALTFVGGGLNNMTATGNLYNQETNKNYKVVIDGVGPDTFKWSDDGGATYEAETVTMLSTNTLNNGVTISWAALTGHTLTNYWTFTAVSPVQTTVGDSGICLPTGSSAFINNDGFRQKGYMNLSVGPQTFGWNTTAYSAWEYRENILTSVKVLGNSSNSSLTVTDTSIFNYNNPDERYILYLMGTDMNGATAMERVSKTLLKLDIDTPISGDEVTFTNDVRYADDGTSLLLSDLMMPRLWISPQKYWVNMLFDSPSTISPRNYTNICTIGQTPTVSNYAGSTFNESVYSYATGSVSTGGLSGRYTDEWDLLPTLDSETVITDQDFGAGAMEEVDGSSTGGSLSVASIINNSFINLDVTAAVDNGSTGTRSNFPMILYYQPTDFELTNHSVFEDDDSLTTEKRPTLYWHYVDLPPTISNLSVSPAFDLLAKDTNLYKLTNEDLNAVRFTWEEDNADDIWYRMLMIDDNIDSKYHKAKLWVPLNEAVVPTPAPAYTYHNVTAQTTGAATVGADVRGVIEGQAGYAAKLSASTAESGSIIIPKGVNTALTNESEFTLVAHWTPSAADNNVISYVANQTTALGTAAANFELFKNASDKIVARLGADIALTGTTTILCDETTPASIIITLNTGSSNPEKARLYINGVLEDTSTGSTLQTTSADFTIGGSGTSTYRTTTGLVEEFIIYTKAWEIPETSNEYVFSTVDILDSDAANDRNITHSARLFVMDYHNIRGYDKASLGLSQSIGWRATTV